MDADHADQVRHRRAFPSQRPVRRCACLADEYRMDDGTVADLCQLAQQGDTGALLWRSHRSRVWTFCAGGEDDAAGRGARSRENVAEHRLYGGPELEHDPGIELD